MSYRFTNTDKWGDSWFSNLSQIEMLLFLYLCDNCDIAGFIEINFKRWASDLGSSKETIEGASKGLTRGLIYSKTNDCIFLKNFLKHQNNLPLNENNKAHLGIIKRFNLYLEKFDIQDINEFIKGASKGLASPTGNGICIGNGIGKEEKEIVKNWKNDFEIYKSELRNNYLLLINDIDYIKERENYHPNLDIIKSLEKSCIDYWATEKGWINKVKSKVESINWNSTFNNALSLKTNQVFKTTQNNQQNKIKPQDSRMNHLQNLLQND
jgi:hypothetical protein